MKSSEQDNKVFVVSYKALIVNGQPVCVVTFVGHWIQSPLLASVRQPIFIIISVVDQSWQSTILIYNKLHSNMMYF